MILRNKTLLLALTLCLTAFLTACGGDETKPNENGTLAEAEKQMILTLAAAMSEDVNAAAGEITQIDGDTVEVTFPLEGDAIFCVTLNKNENGGWVAEPETELRRETAAAE